MDVCKKPRRSGRWNSYRANKNAQVDRKTGCVQKKEEGPFKFKILPVDLEPDKEPGAANSHYTKGRNLATM